MTNNKVSWIALGIAVVAFIGVFVRVAAPIANRALGAAGGMLAENYWPYLMYNDGYKSEKGIVLSGANGDITTGDDLTVTDDATISGGSLVVTTGAGATSTIVVGGIQTYATSSATAICIVPVASTTNMLTGNSFAVQAKYGTCPF